jgi:phage baseplate assembly protein W
MPTNLPRPLINCPLDLRPDRQGQMHYLNLDDSIRQSIQIILSTRQPEQLMRPYFGAGLANFLHEPNTLTTQRRIRDLIYESLTQWESRILLQRVDVQTISDQPSHLRVEIVYQVKRNGVLQQIGLTMQLEG